MPLTPNGSILLYVPFDKDNPVSLKMKEKMTTNEFFERCFVSPEFEKKIRLLNNCSDSEIQEHESFITKTEMITNLNYNKQNLEIFIKWLHDNASSPYVIMGDAGSGKTTFVNYFKHIEANGRTWNLLDLQSANRDILFAGKSLRIEKKGTLKEMIISVLITEIIKYLFLKDEEKEVKTVSKKQILKNIYQYKSNFLSEKEKLNCLETTKNFFVNMPIYRFIYNGSTYMRVEEYIYSYFNKLLHSSNKIDLFDTFLDIYLSIIKNSSKSKQNVVVIDNIERFIKTTEIYSSEIISLMQDLRTITDRNRMNSSRNNIDIFSEKFRFVVCMRRTTVRLFTTQQTSEYLPHILDISNWFQISEIIKKRMEWLKENNIEEFSSMNENYKKRMEYILNDIGFAEGIARGLQQKLDYLFNYDKRIIVEMVNSVLCNPHNELYLKKFDEFSEQKILTPELCRYAARNIIIRLLLNELSEQDEFMQFISNSKEPKTRERLNYVRKMLTVLQNHMKKNKGDPHMSLDSLISKVVDLPLSRVHSFYSNEYKHSLEEISEALFFMNYYNRRANNWIQLIDIQCNEIKKVEVKNGEDMQDFIKSNRKKIKVAITSTGNAYIDYIVQTFEFFSCYYSNYPPLFCLIPEPNEFFSIAIEELECIKVIQDISSKVITFINETLLNDEFVYYNYNGKKQKYSERIVNYHYGHIKNFSMCIYKRFKPLIEAEENEEIKEKMKAFYLEIGKINNEYSLIKQITRC